MAEKRAAQITQALLRLAPYLPHVSALALTSLTCVSRSICEIPGVPGIYIYTWLCTHMLWAWPLSLQYGGPLARLSWAQHAASKPDQNAMLWLEVRGLWECVRAGEPVTVQPVFLQMPTHSEQLSLLTYMFYILRLHVTFP